MYIGKLTAGHKTIGDATILTHQRVVFLVSDLPLKNIVRNNCCMGAAKPTSMVRVRA